MKLILLHERHMRLTDYHTTNYQFRQLYERNIMHKIDLFKVNIWAAYDCRCFS
jgi:hypothetical protein